MPHAPTSEQLLARALKSQMPPMRADTLQLERNTQLQSLPCAPLSSGLQITAGDAVLVMRSQEQGQGYECMFANPRIHCL